MSLNNQNSRIILGTSGVTEVGRILIEESYQRPTILHGIQSHGVEHSTCLDLVLALKYDLESVTAFNFLFLRFSCS
jgi:hypothetical protein